MQTSVCCEKTTDNNVSERMALGIVKTLYTTFCILAAFMSLSFTISQEKTTLSLVEVILSMKVFGDENNVQRIKLLSQIFADINKKVIEILSFS